MLQVESNMKSAIDGLWVLLVSNHGELSSADEQDRVPVMARAGDDVGFPGAITGRRAGEPPPQRRLSE